MPRLVYDDEIRPQPRCPNCGAKFSQASLRIFDNTADCESCHFSVDLSTLASDIEIAPLTARPPRGVALSETASGWAVSARNVSRASIVASCIAVAASILFVRHFLGAWDPVAVAIIALLPAFGTALCIWGKCELRVEWPQGTVFTGVGRLGWSNRFDAAGIQTVTLKQHRGQENRVVRFIELRGQERVAFGQHLDDDQRLYIASYLVAKLNETELARRAPSLASSAL